MTEFPLIAIDFEKGVNLSKEEIQGFILALEEQMKSAPQIDIPLKHYHANGGTDKGVYGREITIPKGALIVGKIHKFETMNVISSGEVSVLSIDGVVRAKAPYTFVSSPGAKRVIYAHQGSTWSTFHGTREIDPDIIEEEFIAKTFDDVALTEKSKETKCLS
jgi:hypothetical protein